LEGLKAKYQRDHPHLREDQICTSYGREPVSFFDYIPRKALDPPIWNEETTHYVLFVRQHQRLYGKLPGFARFDDASLTRGIENAIKQHNVKALYSLLMIEHDFCKERHKRRRCAARNPQSVHPIALPDSLFELACQQDQHSTWILELLAVASHYEIPSDNPSLNGWLDEGKTGPAGGIKKMLVGYRAGE
jgi:hypothetical protein